MKLHLEPDDVMRAFHVRPIVIDGGDGNLVDTACNLYLLWRTDYPDYRPSLMLPHNQTAERYFNEALFKTKETGA